MEPLIPHVDIHYVSLGCCKIVKQFCLLLLSLLFLPFLGFGALIGVLGFGMIRLDATLNT